ncbi:hypothetical protein F5884DRAFT_333851 [Xylogone sp. PMI_703]|nr:hypothetical protein F5884DRAFT_333851 [Xylogone sp. PMI_703]
MVGIQRYTDEQICFILHHRANGMSFVDIVELCKARWPKNTLEWRYSGVCYVWNTYKSGYPQYEAIVAAGTAPSKRKRDSRNSSTQNADHGVGRTLSHAENNSTTTGWNKHAKYNISCESQANQLEDSHRSLLYTDGNRIYYPNKGPGNQTSNTIHGAVFGNRRLSPAHRILHPNQAGAIYIRDNDDGTYPWDGVDIYRYPHEAHETPEAWLQNILPPSRPFNTAKESSSRPIYPATIQQVCTGREVQYPSNKSRRGVSDVETPFLSSTQAHLREQSSINDSFSRKYINAASNEVKRDVIDPRLLNIPPILPHGSVGKHSVDTFVAIANQARKQMSKSKTGTENESKSPFMKALSSTIATQSSLNESPQKLTPVSPSLVSNMAINPRPPLEYQIDRGKKRALPVTPGSGSALERLSLHGISPSLITSPYTSLQTHINIQAPGRYHSQQQDFNIARHPAGPSKYVPKKGSSQVVGLAQQQASSTPGLEIRDILDHEERYSASFSPANGPYERQTPIHGPSPTDLGNASSFYEVPTVSVETLSESCNTEDFIKRIKAGYPPTTPPAVFPADSPIRSTQVVTEQEAENPRDQGAPFERPTSNNELTTFPGAIYSYQGEMDRLWKSTPDLAGLSANSSDPTKWNYSPSTRGSETVSPDCVVPSNNQQAVDEEWLNAEEELSKLEQLENQGAYDVDIAKTLQQRLNERPLYFP